MHAAVIAQRSWTLLDACRSGRLEPVFLRDEAEARTFLTSGEDVRCVVIDVSNDFARSFLAWLRGHPALLSMPVIGLVDAPRTTSYVAALSMGADDAVPATDSAGLAQRLAEVGTQVLSRPAATNGQAIVAHPDPRVRRLVGRHLRHAGFDPVFAADEHELAERSREADPSIVVAAFDGIADPISCVSELRSNGRRPSLPFVWLAGSDEVGTARTLFRDDPQIGVAGSCGPGDNLLFRVNEILASAYAEGRDSRRLLMSTICAYRVAGARHPAHGLTYNVSQRGLYIRSLAPLPSQSDVWLELRPVPDGPWIHLRGDVVWSRRPCDTAGAPPGFGVLLRPNECPSKDLAVWLDSYSVLLDDDEALTRVPLRRPTLAPTLPPPRDSIVRSIGAFR